MTPFVAMSSRKRTGTSRPSSCKSLVSIFQSSPILEWPVLGVPRPVSDLRQPNELMLTPILPADEGYLTDAQGRRADFRNTLVVLTSNLGAEILLQRESSTQKGQEVGDEITPEKQQAVMDIVRSSFAPEFINRLDEFIMFRRLSKQALRDIVDVRLSELQARLDDRRILLEVEGDVRDWLVEHGYDPRYGARPLNRLVASQIGNGLADLIIRGEVKTGQSAEVFVRDSGEGLVVVPSE